MPLYEHVFLGRQDISSQQFEGLMETYQTIIKDNGGSVEKTELWGLKILAYKIKKNRKAHFALMNIDAPHAAVAEMERQMGISTDIIRFLTLRVDEHDTGPTAMMKRGDRDDRRGGKHGRDRDRDRDGGRRGDRDGGPRPRDRENEKVAAKSEKVAAKSDDSKAEKSADKSDDGDAAAATSDSKAEE